MDIDIKRRERGRDGEEGREGKDCVWRECTYDHVRAFRGFGMSSLCPDCDVEMTMNSAHM